MQIHFLRWKTRNLYCRCENMIQKENPFNEEDGFDYINYMKNNSDNSLKNKVNHPHFKKWRLP